MEPQILIFGLFLLGVIEAVSSNDLKSSLTFVIDDTGSMQIDVHELNKTAKSIFETVNSDASHIDDFVVVTFNDPEIKLRNNAHNRSDFENALSVIEPHGGGNCAEMSLSGIQLALDNSRPGSLLWVFTDASAVDMEKYYKVEELSQKMGSQVYFAITGLCDNRTNPDFLVYRDLAIATNGQVFHLRKNEIGKLFKYVESLKEDRMDIVLSKTFPAGGQHIIDVSVDTDMEELIIAVSGEDPVVTVRDPSGLAVATTEVTRLSEIAIVTVDVESGVYKLEVVSKSETHIVVSSPTSVNFQHGFSIYASSNINGTTRKPVPGKQSHLSIQLATEDSEGFEVRSAQILDMDDQVLLEEPLKLVNKALQFYTTEKITPPDHMFKVAVKLYDVRSKTNLTRHGLTPIKPQNETTGDKIPKAPVVTIVGGPKINAAYYHPLQLRCKIKGYPTPSVIWTSSDKSANLTYDKKVSIFEIPDDYISVLDITEVKNNATYTCEATNSKDTNNDSVTVQTQVIKVFNIMELPENATIDYQQPGRIACKVEAFPAAKVSWYKNGELLKPDGNLQVSKDGSVLTVRSMDLYIADSYSCSVENGLDKKVIPFKLSISGLVRPLINKTNPNITAMINSKTDLKCEVTAGVPTPAIHWSYKEVAATDHTNLNTTSHIIHFNKVNASNAGTYFCLAVNAAGSDFLELQLDVKGKCQQPMVKGPCKDASQKWYYDNTHKECRMFTYGGCNGNENNFNSEGDCRAECASTPPVIVTAPPVIVTTPAPIGKCQQPMEVGPCQVAHQMWYYDSGHKECRKFLYGGCNGNENQFNSEAACRAECAPTPPVIVTPPPVIVTTPAPIGKCQQPMEVGPCQAAYQMWYYDSGHKECRKFDYGGCNGNENQFNSEAACRAECAPTPLPVIVTTPPVIVTTPPVIVTTPPVIVTTPARIGCFLDLKKDLNGNDPLMLTQNDEFTNFETDEGHLLIPTNEVIKLVCPVKFSKLILKEIIVTCESEQHFRLQSSGSSYAYSDLKCTDQWQYKTMKTGRQCSNTDSELLNVGFEIRGRFQEVYKVCLNRLTNNPIYTKLNLIQSLPNAIADKNTPWFDNEDSEDLDAAYDCDTQNEAISRILNKEFHNNNSCCFAKRMLVNPLDVAAGLPQAATYSYLNVAPHWSSCNSQNWEEIEQRIRDLRRKAGRTLEVWTGVAQHLQIRDARSDLKNVTLSQSGKEFQVPTYFWKVVHDSVSKASLAIIQVNVPDLKVKDGRKHLLCTDVCKRTEWMKSGHWRDASLGYTYCCELNSFKSAFQLAYYGVFPTSRKLLVDVTNLPNNVV